MTSPESQFRSRANFHIAALSLLSPASVVWDEPYCRESTYDQSITGILIGGLLYVVFNTVVTFSMFMKYSLYHSISFCFGLYILDSAINGYSKSYFMPGLGVESYRSRWRYLGTPILA